VLFLFYGALLLVISKTIAPAVHYISYGEHRHKRMPFPSGLDKTNRFQFVISDTNNIKSLICNQKLSLLLYYAKMVKRSVFKNKNRRH
jgi:hypothetical protein